MKKLMTLIMLAFVGAGGNIEAKPGGIGGTPATITVTRDHSMGSCTLPVQLTIYNAGGTYNQSKILNDLSVTNYPDPVTGMSGLKFKVSIGGQNSVGNNYYLPTTVGQITVIQSIDCGMTNYAGQYGYSVSIKCTGLKQYTLSATKLTCDPQVGCPPCDPNS